MGLIPFYVSNARYSHTGFASKMLPLLPASHNFFMRRLSINSCFFFRKGVDDSGNYIVLLV